MTDENIATGE